MIKLFGFPSSNYYNVVKLVLLEKRIPFQEVPVYLPLEERINAINPTGKIPFIETDDGTLLGESKSILWFLEDVYTNLPLLPDSPILRARVSEIMEIIDLYIEWPMRRLYPEFFEGRRFTDQFKNDVRKETEQGIKSLVQKASFEPFVAGAEITLVDFSAVIHLVQVSIVSRAIFGHDLLEEYPSVLNHRKTMAERSSVIRVKRDRKADLARQIEYQTD